MEIDTPKIWQYFGELIGPMVQDGSVPINVLRKIAEPLKENNKAGLLVAEVLHAASHREVGQAAKYVSSFYKFMLKSPIAIVTDLWTIMQLVMNTYILRDR